MKKSNVDCTESSVLSWPFCGKTILWMANSNRYILAEEPAAMIISRIADGEDICTIILSISKEFNLPKREAESFVNDIHLQIKKYLQPKVLSQIQIEINRKPVFYSKKYYSIYGISFFVEYETKTLESLIHPKFEHLEEALIPNVDHHFQVLTWENKCTLLVDGMPVGTWNSEENYFLSGKFSMQILQKISQKEEDDWMAVFHAAGISDGKSCLMFPGDSGNGKSTLSAILMACGLEVLADDFLPVESQTGLVGRFPAAISIKEKAYELLTPLFPQLMHTSEITNSITGKTFRHLRSDRLKPLSVPCKALIFTKYEKDAGFVFEKMSGEEAFKHLIPDSWISPTPVNAKRFINWFTSLPYYRMTYSDSDQMVQIVKKILSHDL